MGGSQFVQVDGEKPFRGEGVPTRLTDDGGVQARSGGGGQ
jgi:hypothetical protein